MGGSVSAGPDVQLPAIAVLPVIAVYCRLTDGHHFHQHLLASAGGTHVPLVEAYDMTGMTAELKLIGHQSLLILNFNKA